MPIDAQCIQLAAQGNQDSQRAIYESLSARVHRLVLRMVGASDAEDVTQDVFIHLFAKLGSFRYESEFTTWVYRLAVNEALQHLRRARRRTTRPLVEDAAARTESGLGVELKELLDVALSRIDIELRLILELKEVDRLSYSEIAVIVEIPEGTVGSRLNRARRDLRNQLCALGWEGSTWIATK